MAKEYLNQALNLNPHFDLQHADLAKVMLKTLSPDQELIVDNNPN